MKVVAVIPAYNEEKHIASVIGSVGRYVDAVVVVDDGSTDDTFSVASEADMRLRHVVNMGKGLAMKTGVESAITIGADVIVFIDADGQHRPEDIPRLLEKLYSGYDIVNGVRQLNKKMPFVFRIGNWGLNQMFRVLFGFRSNDTQNGYRAFYVKDYLKIRWAALGYAVETEMLALAGLNKLRYGEVSIDTIYLNTVKGTTVIEGVKIGLKMLFWKAKWWLRRL